MKLTTDQGPCNIDLRESCKVVALIILVWTALEVIAFPGILTQSSTFIGLVISVLANVALLYGALKENKWLVLVWLVQEILVFIGWPVTVLGVIFNFGGYRQASNNSIWGGLVNCIVNLIIQLYCTRLVFSYFKQLRERITTPQNVLIA